MSDICAGEDTHFLGSTKRYGPVVPGGTFSGYRPRLLLREHPLPEAGETGPGEERREPDQRGVDRPEAHVRRGGQCGAEPLAHVHERVDEHEELEPTDRLERLPRVVDRTQHR